MNYLFCFVLFCFVLFCLLFCFVLFCFCFVLFLFFVFWFLCFFFFSEIFREKVAMLYSCILTSNWESSVNGEIIVDNCRRRIAYILHSKVIYITHLAKTN